MGLPADQFNYAILEWRYGTVALISSTTRLSADFPEVVRPRLYRHHPDLSCIVMSSRCYSRLSPDIMVYEIGFSTVRNGCNRTFVLAAENANLPSDLAGVGHLRLDVGRPQPGAPATRPELLTVAREIIVGSGPFGHLFIRKEQIEVPGSSAFRSSVSARDSLPDSTSLSPPGFDTTLNAGTPSGVSVGA